MMETEIIPAMNPKTYMSATKTIYQLGKANFCVNHDDPDFGQTLSRLLPLSTKVPNDSEIINVHMGLSFNLRLLLSEIINQHQQCLLIQAAALQSPNGARMLLSGGPGSGKTTLAIALALKHDWKVFTEDMTIIDPENNELTTFGAPFKLKQSMRQILAESGVELAGFIFWEWFPLSPSVTAANCQAKLDVAIHLEGQVCDQPLSCESISVSDYIRKLLPISNLLSQRATTKFADCLPQNSCYSMSGGTVAERLQKISELSTVER
ncbi:MAG TPA: hypothetical protein V6C89_09540 [Drouetiella sp.]|jgi:hypothetical protein